MQLFVETAGELIAPAKVANPEAGSRFVFTVEVDDVDAMCAELTAHRQLHRSWRSYLGDRELASAQIRPGEEGEFMESNKVGFSSIDEYIATFPEDIQKLLKELRATIRASAPNAAEKFSYGMPTFFLNGNLVHFAAFKTHIGFYPTPGGIEAFKDELSNYRGAKGSVQFPVDRPLPLKLISKIVRFRVAENLKIARTKSSRKKQGRSDGRKSS